MQSPTLGSLIAGRIRAAGYRQKEFAAMIGCGESYLSRVLRSGDIPKQMLEKIAEQLGVEVIDLFTEPESDWSDSSQSQREIDELTARLNQCLEERQRLISIIENLTRKGSA